MNDISIFKGTIPKVTDTPKVKYTFKTKEDIDKAEVILDLHSAILSYKYRYDNVKLNWYNESVKYIISYLPMDYTYIISEALNIQTVNGVYFSSKGIAEDCIMWLLEIGLIK